MLSLFQPCILINKYIEGVVVLASISVLRQAKKDTDVTDASSIKLGYTIRGHVRVEQRENRCGRKMVLEGGRKSGKAWALNNLVDIHHVRIG